MGCDEERTEDVAGEESRAEQDSDEEFEPLRGELQAWRCEGAVCVNNEGPAEVTRIGESFRSSASVGRRAFLRDAPVERSGDVSFNLDMALPILVAGVETGEPERSKESASLLAPKLALEPRRE